MSRGTVLITGAASGIGEAFARLFALEGFDLILTARRQEKLEDLSDQLSSSVDVTVISADLASEQGLSKLYQTIEDRQLNVDILVNNAGMMVQDEFTQLTVAQLEQIITLNITALTHLTHHFLPTMIANNSGRILNVASVAAFHPVPGMDIYAATKSFVLSLTESLAENLRGTGVSLTALCPGITDTELADQSLTASLPPFMVSSPEAVAKEGYEALMSKEVIRVPGDANKLALTWAQHQPRWLVRGLGGLVARFGGRNH